MLAVLGALAALLAAGFIYQAIGAARDRTRFPPVGRLVNVGGRYWHLIESGTGSPAVILESGISASCLNWTQIRTEVARFARVCAYDRAGLGWSERADSPRLASQLVAELHGVLRAAGIPPPYLLVGHSFGGLLVSLYAVRYPGEVAGLVLVDPLAPSEWARASHTQARILRWGVRLARRGAWLARFGVVRLALALFLGGARRVPKQIARITSGQGESTISRIVGEVGKMPREVWPMVQSHWCSAKSFQGLAAALEALPAASAEAVDLEPPGAIPVTILSARTSTGEERAVRQAMADKSVRGRHIVAAKSGHWVHLDEPELVIEAIREMLVSSRPSEDAPART